MNQKITLRFADHVLTFTILGAEAAQVEQDFRRKWLHRFVAPNGTFLVNFDQVLWMKISSTDDTVTELGTEETAQEEVTEYQALFDFGSTPSWPSGLPRGGTP